MQLWNFGIKACVQNQDALLEQTLCVFDAFSGKKKFCEATKDG